MQHAPILEVARHAIRGAVCTRCYQRPPGSEAHGPQVPRSCEGRCTIFAYLTKVWGLAHQAADPWLLPYELAMKERICSHCTVSPSPGDYCGSRVAAECPLNRYLSEVIEVVTRVAVMHGKRVA